MTLRVLMERLFFLSVLAVIIYTTNCTDNHDIITSYIKEKSVKYATVFGCFTKKEKINLVKIISHICPISVFDINRLNIENRMESRHFHTGIILDGDCPSAEKFLINCGRSYLFDVKHHWLIVASSEKIREKFNNVILNINADINVIIPEKPSNWSIIDVYNPASQHGGVLNFTRVGFYNKHDGYKIKYTGVKYWNRKNLTGVTFKSMVVLPVPFEGTLQHYLDSDDNRDVNTFNRFHSRLISFCRDYYNFSLDIEVSKSWGYTNEDGTFDGMVGALERKIIDFGSSPLFLREDRARVIDYGRNTWILSAAFIFRNPKVRTSLEIFLRPLPSSVWLITGLLAIVSIIILKLATSFERRRYVYDVETSWSISVIFTLGAFCQQGSPSTPKMACGRIATFFIFLLSVLIYQFYSASLVSHLLNKPLTKIKNVRDLLLSPLKAGCEDILYDRDYFLHTTDKVAKELYAKKILGKSNSSNFHTPEAGLKLVAEGGYAFHVETATAYPIIESTFQDQAVCELREVPLFRTQPMHANFQKKSPFRDMFDTCFQRLAEHGLLVRERKHWHPRKPECIQSSKSIRFNVGLDDFYPALVILLVGIVASLLILVIEKEFRILTENPAPPPILVLEAEDAPYPYVD
nr:PREDICTED: glutamate receptor ionotropic, delta-2-like isoform X2 [Tribolium castaneum]|eukprot:XP_008196050.2 PREDICTED: glutamate receptor ionotropic, delta-2-like isoform X2 [Tribolium castaneum]